MLVRIADEELRELEPEPSRTIEITRFVAPTAVGHQWYARPYLLAPDGDEESYAAFVAALEETGTIGIARWVMRKKEYVGALLEEDGYLMLITLRHAGEVIPVTALNAPQGRALDQREVNMAKQLVSALEGELDMTQFRDEYRDRVLELVEAKAEGKVVKFPKVERREEEGSLAEMLARSVKATKQRRVRG